MWYAVTVQLAQNKCEQLTEIMLRLGAPGVSIDGGGFQLEQAKTDYQLPPEELPDLQNSPSDLFLLTSYFADCLAAEEFRQRLFPAIAEDGLQNILANEIDIVAVDEKQWENEWKKYYHVFKPGRRIVIVPAWEEYDRQEGETTVLMDPGMAFGSGTHESTVMCIKLLEENIHGGEMVADIGCGSGILGIAALRLGAILVDGVEIDNVAVEVARKNIQINNLGDRFCVYSGDGTSPLAKSNYDLVVANIVASVIKNNLLPFRNILRAGGLAIFSGIIAEKWPEIAEALLENGFTILRCIEENGWIAVCLRKSDTYA